MVARKEAKKRKNPADTTMRNIRALKKRVEILETYVDSKFLVFDDIWRALKREIDRK